LKKTMEKLEKEIEGELKKMDKMVEEREKRL
jgi:hypothetical protein